MKKTKTLPKITEKDLEKLKSFLTILFEPTDYINLTCLYEHKENKHEKPDNFNLSYKNLEKKMDLDFFKLKYFESKNICICPNPLKKNTKRKEENVACLNTLFVDVDNKNIDLESIFPKPHVVINRGQKNFHLYWFIDRLKPTQKNKEIYKEVEEFLIFQVDGDPPVKDPARLLRLPYTYHHKNPAKVSMYKIKTLENSLPRYNLYEIHKTIEKNKKNQKHFDSSVNGSQTLSETQGFKSTDEYLTNFLWSSYRGRPPLRQNQGRSQALFFVGLDCYGWGIEESKAVKLAQKFNNLLCMPPESENVLKHQIQSAFKYYKGSFGEYKTEFGESKNIENQKKILKTYQTYQNIREVLKKWVYVASAERLIKLTTSLELTNSKQIANYTSYLCSSTVPFNIILAKQLVKVVEYIDFRPDIQKRVFIKNNEKYLNRFRPLEITEKEKLTKKDLEKVKIFTSHLEYLTTTPYEYNTLLNFLAFIVQNIGEKLTYALVLISKEQGVGKSILEILFRNFFPDNVGAIENEQLTSGWSHYLEDRLLIFVHELAQTDKYSIVNRFKNLITEPYVEINKKNARQYTVRNTVNFIMFSNTPDAIKIDKYDRRFFVIYNKETPKSQSYYKNLVKLFREDYQILYTFLKNIDLSKFDPFERPQMTDGKEQLIQYSTSELNLFLSTALKNREGVFKYPLILSLDIQNYVETYGNTIIRYRASLKAIGRFLLEAGFQNVRVHKRIKGYRINRSFWIKEDIKTIKNIDETILKVLNLDNVENTMETVKEF